MIARAVLEDQIADMMDSYGLEKTELENLRAYAEQIGIAAVSNLLSEAKANGTLETIRKGDGTFSDLLGVSGGQEIRKREALESTRAKRRVVLRIEEFITDDVLGKDSILQDVARVATASKEDLTAGCSIGVLGHNVD